jgi:hypothetical protein
MAAVQDMAKLQRLLFEVEREFVRTATTLIYRVGEPELKYLLCQHVWESAGHARFLHGLADAAAGLVVAATRVGADHHLEVVLGEHGRGGGRKGQRQQHGFEQEASHE